MAKKASYSKNGSLLNKNPALLLLLSLFMGFASLVAAAHRNGEINGDSLIGIPIYVFGFIVGILTVGAAVFDHDLLTKSLKLIHGFISTPILVAGLAFTLTA